MKYVALLRGINVGGNHRVPKLELKKVFEDLAFRDVTIYLNSGNVIFASENKPDAVAIQSAFENKFGFAIPTLVLSAKQIQAIAAAIPSEWTNDMPKPDKSGYKSDVVYLFDEVNKPDVLQRIGYLSEIETMLYVDGAVLASVSKKNQTKSSLLRVVGTPPYKHMTVRNITTAKKLAELVKL